MIISIFLYLVYGVVYVLTSPLRALSDVTVESGVGEAISNAIHYIANFNDFLPISTIASIIGLVVTIEVGLAVYKLAMWLIRRLPTQS